MKTLISFLSLLALTLTVSCQQPSANSKTSYSASGGTSSPIIPTSWTVATWFIDPVSGDDNNAGTTSGAPLKTWHRLNDQIWGCAGSPTACPRLRQDTAITWLSSDTTSTDPVYFLPAIENQAHVSLLGTLSGGTTTTLASVTSGGAATRTALELAAPTAGTFTTGAFIVNTTHPGAAWAFKVSSGAIWKLTQPLSRTVVPQTFVGSPTELTNWANGDAITFYANPTSVNLAVLKPTFTTVSSALNSNVIVQGLNITAPVSSNYDKVYLSSSVVLQETRSAREVVFDQVASGLPLALQVDDFLQNGITGQNNSSLVLGGFTSCGPVSEDYPVNMSFDFDVVLGASLTNITACAIVGLLPGANVLNGAYYVDTGVQVELISTSESGGVSGASVVYGPGTIDALGHNTYPSGASGAANSLKTTGLKINGGTKMCTSQPGSALTTLVCNITVSAANLDTAAGATAAGCGYVPGGGSYCNTVF